jgi:pimeloyl-ACP methyl ester carboxylesterase
MRSISTKISGFLLLIGALGGCQDDQKEQDPLVANSAEASAMQTVTSSDGTKIAYEKVGSGPPVILVNGALSGRKAGSKIATLLAPHFTVYTYDRRGRGESGDTKPYAVEREIEDIAALIDVAGGAVSLAGFSSGAALSLEAASALGPKVGKLVVYEAPYDDAENVPAEWKAYKAEQAALLAAGRRGEAVEHHLKYVGAPEAAIAEMKASPAWAEMEAMAQALPYDAAVVGEDRSVPVERVARIKAEALVMDGGASREAMPFMRTTADKIAKAIPKARRHTLEGQAHNASAEAISPVLVEFLSAQ